jgi:hypothetical protein
MSCVPYESFVGILMYAMFFTRLGIAHAVGVLSRYMSTPKKENWTIFKRVFRYLCGTKDYAICYQGKPEGDSGKLYVHGFFDSNWGYVFDMFGEEKIWMSKRQEVVALLTTEVEYMVATHGRKEVV